MALFDEGRETEGNNCAFFLFEIVNHIIFVLGVIICVLGTFICVMSDEITLVDSIVVCVGLLIILLSIYSHYIKTSLGGLTLYIALTFIYLMFLLTITLVAISSPEGIIGRIGEHLPDHIKHNLIKQGKTYLNTIGFILLAIITLTVQILHHLIVS